MWNWTTVPYADSNKRKAYRKAYYARNATKAKAQAKAQRVARVTPEAKEAWHKYQRNRMLLQRYRISSSDYDELYAQQSGKCAICFSDKKGVHKRYLDVDHCHKSGEVRGLLCGRCNKNLAVLEDIKWRTAAETYLAKQR